MSSVRAEVTKSVRVVQGACMDLDKNLRGMDANTQSALEDERNRRQMVIMLLCILYNKNKTCLMCTSRCIASCGKGFIQWLLRSEINHNGIHLKGNLLCMKGFLLSSWIVVNLFVNQLFY